MGVNHGGGRGGRVPPRIWSAGDASANRPPQNLSCFKIRNTSCLHTMQYSVLPKLFVTAISQILDKTIQHTTLTAYSLPIIPKSTSSTSTKSPLQAENSTFFWRGKGQKYRSEFTKTHHFKSKNSFFFWRGGLPVLSETSLLGLAFVPPPRIPARFTPLSAMD